MAIKARDDVTLASITDVSYTRRYYLLQSSTLNPPAAPTVNPAPSPWVTTEPSYTEGSTNSLYTVDLTVFTDAGFDYSQVSKSSSYEAAKAAYNKAVAAQNAANAAQTTANGKNKITRSTAAASGAGVAGDQWWQYSGSQVIGFWIHNGSSWASQTLTDSVITNLNAGTITAGTLNADRIGANSITTAKIAANAVTANEIAANSITATNGIVQSLDAGKITTGTINAARIAANSITADKLNANAFTGQTFTGSVFTAGGGALPQVLVGPSSGIPGTGDTYGMKITTPSNGANGSAVLAVSPAGPYMEFYDGTGKQVLAADKTGIRVPNRTSGGMVDLSLLVANATSFTIDKTFNLQFPPSQSGTSPWSSPSFFRNPWSSLNIGSVGKVSSPTGKILFYGGCTIDAPATDQLGIELQWNLHTQDPSNYAWNETGKNTYGLSMAPSRSDVGGTGISTVGMIVANVEPNVEYWVTPKYWTYNFSNSTVTRNITRLWMYATPTV